MSGNPLWPSNALVQYPPQCKKKWGPSGLGKRPCTGWKNKCRAIRGCPVDKRTISTLKGKHQYIGKAKAAPNMSRMRAKDAPSMAWSTNLWMLYTCLQGFALKHLGCSIFTYLPGENLYQTFSWCEPQFAPVHIGRMCWFTPIHIFLGDAHNVMFSVHTCSHNYFLLIHTYWKSAPSGKNLCWGNLEEKFLSHLSHPGGQCGIQ